MAAPLPFAHQWFGLMPLPMNTTAKRFGADGSSVARAAARIVAVDPNPGGTPATAAPW